MVTEVVLDQKQEVKAFSPFGKRNSTEERIKDEEEEIKNLQEANKPSEGKVEEESAEPETAEEKSFKKRYGDLRRHSQQQQTQLQSQIDALKSQLEQSTSKQIKFPKTEEELNEWATQYPDVAKIVETIAMKKAKEQSKEIEDRFRQLDEREQQTAKERAESELMRLHPDFGDIRDDDAFHDWVEDQPKWVQQALYENDNDAKAAARAIDLYKSDKGIKTKKESSSKDAAQSVGARNARSTPAPEDVSGTFYESQVNKMSTNDYETNQEAIAKAIKSGKFVYDLSGNAR
jgi:DNA repair exonuclease SbcCD ATPase subunit